MKHNKTPLDLHEYDLETLERVEFMFSIFSDSSTNTLGYRRLVEMIKDLKEIQNGK